MSNKQRAGSVFAGGLFDLWSLMHSAIVPSVPGGRFPGLLVCSGGAAGPAPAGEAIMIPDLERGLDELQRKLEQLKVYL